MYNKLEEQAVLALYRHIPDRALCHKIVCKRSL